MPSHSGWLAPTGERSGALARAADALLGGRGADEAAAVLAASIPCLAPSTASEALLSAVLGAADDGSGPGSWSPRRQREPKSGDADESSEDDDLLVILDDTDVPERPTRLESMSESGQSTGVAWPAGCTAGRFPPDTPPGPASDAVASLLSRAGDGVACRAWAAAARAMTAGTAPRPCTLERLRTVLVAELRSGGRPHDGEWDAAVDGCAAVFRSAAEAGRACDAANAALLVLCGLCGLAKPDVPRRDGEESDEDEEPMVEAAGALDGTSPDCAVRLRGGDGPTFERWLSGCVLGGTALRAGGSALTLRGVETGADAMSLLAPLCRGSVLRASVRAMRRTLARVRASGHPGALEDDGSDAGGGGGGELVRARVREAVESSMHVSAAAAAECEPRRPRGAGLQLRQAPAKGRKAGAGRAAKRARVGAEGKPAEAAPAPRPAPVPLSLARVERPSLASAVLGRSSALPVLSRRRKQ